MLITKLRSWFTNVFVNRFKKRKTRGSYEHTDESSEKSKSRTDNNNEEQSDSKREMPEMRFEFYDFDKSKRRNNYEQSDFNNEKPRTNFEFFNSEKSKSENNGQSDFKNGKPHEFNSSGEFKKSFGFSFEEASNSQKDNPLINFIFRTYETSKSGNNTNNEEQPYFQKEDPPKNFEFFSSQTFESRTNNEQSYDFKMGEPQMNFTFDSSDKSEKSNSKKNEKPPRVIFKMWSVKIEFLKGKEKQIKEKLKILKETKKCLSDLYDVIKQIENCRKVFEHFDEFQFKH